MTYLRATKIIIKRKRPIDIHLTLCYNNTVEIVTKQQLLSNVFSKKWLMPNNSCVFVNKAKG